MARLLRPGRAALAVAAALGVGLAALASAAAQTSTTPLTGVSLSRPAANGSAALTLTGSFAPGSAASWNGAPLAMLSRTRSQLVALVPNAARSDSGNVVVTAPAGSYNVGNPTVTVQVQVKVPVTISVVGSPCGCAPATKPPGSKPGHHSLSLFVGRARGLTVPLTVRVRPSAKGAKLALERRIGSRFVRLSSRVFTGRLARLHLRVAPGRFVIRATLVDRATMSSSAPVVILVSRRS